MASNVSKLTDKNKYYSIRAANSVREPECRLKKDPEDEARGDE